MYHMSPYMYRNFRAPKSREHESIGQNTPFKRGDLEGYVAAKDFTSIPYAACTRAKAIASINSGTVLRADMTPKEYINLLIRQGQVPDKHFTYKQTDTGYEINELNSYRETTKKVIFNNPEANSEPSIICQYFTPDSGRQYREVKYYTDGNVETRNDYEELFNHEELAIAEMQKLEDLRKAGPQTVPIARGDNPFMHDIPLPINEAPPTIPPVNLITNPIQPKYTQVSPQLATVGL